jgi:hypothetical protein
MRSTLKFILVVSALMFGAMLVFLGWKMFEMKVVWPWQYERFRKEAAQWNLATWESGTALIVTVQVTSRTALGADIAVADVVCYEKQFAVAGGLKGPPGIWTRMYSDGPDFLVADFGQNATHQTDLKDVCHDSIRSSEHWSLPYVTESHYYWSNVVADDQTFQCFLGNKPRTTTGEVTRPTFVSIRKLPLRDLIEREEYANLPENSRDADMYMYRVAQYSWWDEQSEKCSRRKTTEPCAPDVELVCGRLLP